jgi:hypothetical protein
VIVTLLAAVIIAAAQGCHRLSGSLGTPSTPTVTTAYAASPPTAATSPAASHSGA